MDSLSSRPNYHSVQSLSRVWLFVVPWTAARQASLSITNSWSLHKLMSIELVMPSNHLILCCPLLCPPSIFPSNRVFSNESILPIRWPKHWSFSLSISSSNEYSGLISFRMDCLDLLTVQGTLKSLLQHHGSKATMGLQSRTWLSHWTEPRLVITFLPRSKCLFISWLQSQSAVIMEPQKIKTVTVCIVSPSVCHGVMGPDTMILVFWVKF